MRFVTPAAFATEPELDGTVLAGFEAWLLVARGRGAVAVTQWLERRYLEASFDFHMIFRAIESLLELSEDRYDRQAALAEELANRLVAGDAEMAELFWQPVLEWALATGDEEQVLTAGTAIANIVFTFDEPRTAGRVWVDILNWSRADGRTVSSELVETAFDYVIAAANSDGAQQYAALLEYRQVAFHRQFDTDGPSPVTGDWAQGTPLFALWFGN